jgi:hypothetical protein
LKEETTESLHTSALGALVTFESSVPKKLEEEELTPAQS